MKGEKKPILCVDFDGVLHSYKSGWKGAMVIPDPPVPDMLLWLVEATDYFRVCIYSSRSRQFGGKRAMKRWLIAHLSAHIARYKCPKRLLPADTETNPSYDRWMDGVIRSARSFVRQLKFPTKKPAAFMTVDDRAYCFQGNPPDLDELFNFQPWNKKGV